MNDAPEEKAPSPTQAEAATRKFLRSKSWVEKVESIERMNVADKVAKQAMRDALATQRRPVLSDGQS